MKTEEFDYILPSESIAQYPSAERDESRLLVYHRASRKIHHRKFRDLPEYMCSGDLFIRNNTKVIKAAVRAFKNTGGKVEIIFLRSSDNDNWLAMTRSSRPVLPGTILMTEKSTAIEIKEKVNNNLFKIKVQTELPVLKFLENQGTIP
ncbi:MAG: S-adenosylmethionine:tRNA ribosyltransferase-isomerase, partial [bacterium]